MVAAVLARQDVEVGLTRHSVAAGEAGSWSPGRDGGSHGSEQAVRGWGPPSDWPRRFASHREGSTVEEAEEGTTGCLASNPEARFLAGYRRTRKDGATVVDGVTAADYARPRRHRDDGSLRPSGARHSAQVGGTDRRQHCCRYPVVHRARRLPSVQSDPARDTHSRTRSFGDSHPSRANWLTTR